MLIYSDRLTDDNIDAAVMAADDKRHVYAENLQPLDDGPRTRGFELTLGRMLGGNAWRTMQAFTDDYGRVLAYVLALDPEALVTAGAFDVRDADCEEFHAQTRGRYLSHALKASHAPSHAPAGVVVPCPGCDAPRALTPGSTCASCGHQESER